MARIPKALEQRVQAQPLPSARVQTDVPYHTTDLSPISNALQTVGSILRAVGEHRQQAEAAQMAAAEGQYLAGSTDILSTGKDPYLRKTGEAALQGRAGVEQNLDALYKNVRESLKQPALQQAFDARINRLRLSQLETIAGHEGKAIEEVSKAKFDHAWNETFRQMTQPEIYANDVSAGILMTNLLGHLINRSKIEGWTPEALDDAMQKSADAAHEARLQGFQRDSDAAGMRQYLEKNKHLMPTQTYEKYRNQSDPIWTDTLAEQEAQRIRKTGFEDPSVMRALWDKMPYDTPEAVKVRDATKIRIDRMINDQQTQDRTAGEADFQIAYNQWRDGGYNLAAVSPGLKGRLKSNYRGIDYLEKLEQVDHNYHAERQAETDRASREIKDKLEVTGTASLIDLMQLYQEKPQELATIDLNRYYPSMTATQQLKAAALKRDAANLVAGATKRNLAVRTDLIIKDVSLQNGVIPAPGKKMTLQQAKKFSKVQNWVYQRIQEWTEKPENAGKAIPADEVRKIATKAFFDIEVQGTGLKFWDPDAKLYEYEPGQALVVPKKDRAEIELRIRNAGRKVTEAEVQKKYLQLLYNASAEVPGLPGLYSETADFKDAMDNTTGAPKPSIEPSPETAPEGE
jgi:hypothetical protein